MTKQSGIYMIVRLETGDYYLGSSADMHSSAEAKARMSEIQRELFKDPEMRRKVSDGLRGRASRLANPHTLTPAGRARIGAAARARHQRNREAKAAQESKAAA